MKHTSHIFFFILCLAASISHAQLPSYLPTNGLVAWYPFNGNANDESGNGNNGVVHGATLCADQNAIASSAYDFSGADSYIEIASSPIQSQGSLIAWVLPRSAAAVNNNWDYSASLIDQTFDAQNNSGVGLYYHNSIHGVYAQVGWSGNNNNFINANPIQPLSLAEWQQVVFTFVQNSCSLYLNGELIATRTDMNAPSMSTANLYFGRAPWGGNQFNGQLDDIAIYNRALTQSEITVLYTATATNTAGGTTSTSPAPPGIPYQAEVRNESGEVLVNANVNVRFTLHELTANGTVSYQETHALTTNELGLFAATIGAGTATQGTFAGINWSQTTKFLQVEVDTGNGYITMGNQQLMSVPYALYAANGPAGPQGPVGPQGPAGVDGQPGAQGQNGLSAYEVWLAQGNSGTEQDYFQYLVNMASANNPSSGLGNHGIVEVNASQVTSWVVPQGVYFIQVRMHSSFGGASGQICVNGTNCAWPCNSGPGGTYSSAIFNYSVTPGQQFQISVGTNGVNGVNSNSTCSAGTAGTNGTNCNISLNGISLITCTGGKGGSGASTFCGNAPPCGTAGQNGEVFFTPGTGLLNLQTAVGAINGLGGPNYVRIEY